jgi:hypothetical protein
MRYKVIACEVFYREICFAAARSPHTIDLEFLPKGLHDIGAEGMSSRLQAVIDRVEQGRYDAIILGYALCNNGTAGLKAGHTKIVIPRAHDCITLFFGSSERYLDYFNDHPGVYYQTTGWIERGEAEGEYRQLSIAHKAGMDRTYEEFVEKYGEENARFLYEQLGQFARNYGQVTFIEMGIERDASFEIRARESAERRGWTFEKVTGDMSMIQRLLDGNWDEKEFLLLSSGESIAPSYDDSVIKSLKPDAEPRP